MTKLEFKQYSKNCPLHYHRGEPRCKIQDKKHCAKKNCPFIYWLEIYRRITHVDE
uniref:Uncharacterized protein n=1 Tax=viral metagenome TaxID=1070528 RepID=A0A6M3K826_9ZZZZ